VQTAAGERNRRRSGGLAAEQQGVRTAVLLQMRTRRYPASLTPICLRNTFSPIEVPRGSGEGPGADNRFGARSRLGYVVEKLVP
jgi:hypothetical protein